jgi:hypothetical protein
MRDIIIFLYIFKYSVIIQILFKLKCLTLTSTSSLPFFTFLSTTKAKFLQLVSKVFFFTFIMIFFVIIKLN